MACIPGFDIQHVDQRLLRHCTYPFGVYIDLSYAKNANYDCCDYEDTIDCIVKNHNYLINRLIAQACLLKGTIYIYHFDH